MIPVSLTLQGIYSFQQPQHIDFKKLTDARLFGIFGNVGSGKSTILEAITFALYGESERLNKRENRSYNMMNLKSDELLIDFVFQSGKEDRQYRFIVHGKRNKTHFERINPFERKAYELRQREWYPLEANSAESILGLSYEHFKRTIIIPQGKFQEFLELKDKDRTQMLKEIFNLERFELSDKVGALEKANNDELIRLEEQLTGLEDATEEARKEKEEERKNQETQIKNLAQTYEKQKERYQQLKSLKDLNNQLYEARQELGRLEEQKPGFDKRQEQLDNYKHCRYYFAEPINKANALENEVNQLDEALQKLDEEKKGKDQAVLDQRRELTRIQKLFANEDRLKASIADLKTIIAIKDFEASLSQIDQQCRDVQKLAGDQQQLLDQQKEEQQRLKGQIRQYKQEKLDQGTLGAVKNWFTQKNNLLRNIRAYEQEIQQADEQIHQLVDERKKAIQDNGLAKLQEGILEMPVNELVPFLEDQRRQLEKRQNETEQTLQHYRVKEELQAYASNLEDGRPCPVCGATHHPDKMEAEDVQSRKQEAEQENLGYQQQIKAIDAALRAIEGLKQSYQVYKKQKDQNEQKLKATRDQFADHQKAFEWEAYRDYTEEAVDRLSRKAQNQAEEMENLENQLSKVEQQMEKEEQALKKLHDQEQEFKRQVSGYQERIHSYKQQLQQLRYDDYQESGKDQLENQVKEWEQMLKQYQVLEENIENLQKTADEKKHAIQYKTEQRDSKKAELKAVQKDLDHLVDQSRYENLGEIKGILDQKLDVDEEEVALKAFYNQYHQQTGVVKNLEKTLSEKAAFDQETFDRVAKELEETEQHLNEARNQKAVLEQSLKELDQKLERKKELKQKQEKLQTRHENIKTLKNIFKGSGFVKYVSSVFLEQLCQAANARFSKLTRQQLRLEVTADNNFLVRDYLNNGKVRSVKTLSGGQTFQASLSLALALAEHIQHLTNANQNFFFLDEGFGSQDEASLAIVFETLKSLRKENRIVGIISHVEALKETIDVSLHIESDPEEGSRVIGSWEMH